MTDPVEAARLEVYAAARGLWAIATRPIPANAPERFDAAVAELIRVVRDSVRGQDR